MGLPFNIPLVHPSSTIPSRDYSFPPPPKALPKTMSKYPARKRRPPTPPTSYKCLNPRKGTSPPISTLPAQNRTVKTPECILSSCASPSSRDTSPCISLDCSCALETQKRMSKLRRHLGETVPIELLCIKPSSSTKSGLVSKRQLEQVVKLNRYLGETVPVELIVGGSRHASLKEQRNQRSPIKDTNERNPSKPRHRADADSFEESDNLKGHEDVEVEKVLREWKVQKIGQTNVKSRRDPAWRSSMKWIRERGSKRWVETDHNVILKALRAL